VGHFRHTQKIAIISLEQRNKICKASKNPGKEIQKKRQIKSEGQTEEKMARPLSADGLDYSSDVIFIYCK